MDFILMLTRNDRTIEDAACLVDVACELGVRHIGFKDVGVPFATMQEVTGTIRRRGGTCYLEVVSTTREAMHRSLEAARALGVDRILGGTDVEAAQRILGDLSRYFPFPGNPVGHPTRLGGSAALVADHCRRACALGCGGVDLLAFRATEADPLDLVRAAREALPAQRLIVAGSVNSRERIHALAAAGVDAFTIGSAVFEGTFSPAKGSFRGQIQDILEACARAPRMAAMSAKGRPEREYRSDEGSPVTGIRAAHRPGERNVIATTASALDQLLRGDYPDPDGGPPIGVPVKAVRIERSLHDIEADLVAPFGLGRRLAVVSDPATRAVLGRRLERALSSLATIVPVVLEARPHADAETVATVRRACADADALVAVGSGTINDLCKFAAAQDGKPYVVFATAPSMNGYTSMNAAITVDGHKKTLPAATPLAVFMDLEILAAAPARMIQAGLGDSLCRATAQVDWLLSHHLHGTPFRSAPFAMLAQDESILLDAPEALLAGDLDAMRALARTLVLSGLGMTICGGSYPASQGEHLISHYIDMFAPPGCDTFFHGEQVAVATLTMARIQEEVLAAGPPQFEASPITRTDLETRLGADVGESCWREFDPKRVTAETALPLTQRAARMWSNLSGGVRRASISATRLESIMLRARVPTVPADIGLAPDFYAAAVRNARFLRDRYTFLDLADDSGHLARMWPG